MAQTVPSLSLFQTRKTSHKQEKTLKENTKLSKLIQNQKSILGNVYQQKIYLDHMRPPLHLPTPLIGPIPIGPCPYQTFIDRGPLYPPIYQPIYIPSATYFHQAEDVLTGRTKGGWNNYNYSPSRDLNKTTSRFGENSGRRQNKERNPNISRSPYTKNMKPQNNPNIKVYGPGNRSPPKKQIQLTKNVYLTNLESNRKTQINKKHQTNKNIQIDKKKGQDNQNKPNNQPSIEINRFVNNKNLITNESIVIDSISQHTKNQHSPQKQPRTYPFNPVNFTSTETQTQKQPPISLQVNRSSFLIERVTRHIPDMMDDITFRRMLKQQTEQFNSVRIQGGEQDLIFDLSDLYHTKDDYVERSTELLVRLNELSSDKNQFSLVNRVLGFSKKKQDIVWPQV